jgi:hypothetical protein
MMNQPFEANTSKDKEKDGEYATVGGIVKC